MVCVGNLNIDVTSIIAIEINMRINPMTYLKQTKNDKYVHMMHDINMSIPFLSSNTVAYVFLAYTILRLIYPNQRWRIMKEKGTSKFILLGRDYEASEYPLATLVPVCSTDDMRDAIMEIADIMLRANVSHLPLEERHAASNVNITLHPLRQGPLYKLITSLKNNGEEKKVAKIIDAVERGDASIAYDLFLMEYAVPSVYVSIQASNIYHTIQTILDEIPPTGCGTLFHRRTEALTDINVGI